MNEIKVFGNHPMPLDIKTGVDIEVYIDRFNTDPIPADTIRVIILQEVFRSNVSVDCDLRDFIYNHPDKYTFVLTHIDEILISNPKAKLLMATSSWVYGHEPEEKNFCISTLVGGKNNPLLEGYALRHKVWNNKEKIITPTDFYLSSHTPWDKINYSANKVLGDSKVPLFNSQYHIAIENTSINNMFTEKLIDCFQTKTIPIYYGAPNIGDTFNSSGIIMVNSLDDIINACNQLTPDTYERMLPIVIDNYETSLKYCDYNKQIKEAIISTISEL